MKKIIITIDGHAGSGKSSTAKAIAKKLDYKYINSGVLYRAITLYMLEKKIDVNDEDKVNEALKNIKLDFKYELTNGITEMYLNGINVINKLYNIEIEKIVGIISTYNYVREKIVFLQQQVGVNGGIVVDGRDTGTKVFPNADLKIFMTAHIDERVKRRYLEIINKGKNIDIERLKKSMVERDRIDQERDISPLQIAKDAIKIDNTNHTFEENMNNILNLAHQKIHAFKFQK